MKFKITDENISFMLIASFGETIHILDWDAKDGRVAVLLAMTRT